MREEWSGLVVAVRKGRRRNHEERSQSVTAATPAAREERPRCEIRNARSERFFWGPEKRGRGGTGGEEHDGVDGDLKGNERGMMQAWVRIAAKAGDARRTEEKRNEGT